ncbi:arylsulfatase [Vibrio maerlii]|uniref:arylsulfatase n=1 Tax=Vibrio maerlii TaxID=2231648 RepID=UPI000E3C34FD|nr:arylsulfatase [Vibrio maerlii]
MKLQKTALAVATAGVATLPSLDSQAASSDNTDSAQPNVVLIMTDDMGFSDLSCYGGEIPTPNICALAEDGVKMTDYYTNPMSAPTRSMLLTGVDNHKAGLGNMPPLMSSNQVGIKGYEGALNNSVITVAEVLKSEGYKTMMAGKWHLGSNYPQSAKARGFEHSFEFTGGGISHFGDQLPMNPFEAPFFFYRENGERVNELPRDFYSSDYYVDKLIEYIGEEKPEQPIFAYAAFTSPHDPLHAPDEWLDKFDPSMYEQGYDKIRQTRLARVKELGLVSQDTADVRNNGDYKPWDQLSEEEQKRAAKIMSVYAAMIANMDHNVGRLVQHLKDIGEYENTIFIYTHDNGSGPKPSTNYTGNTAPFMEQFDNSYDNIGKPSSFVSMGAGFAEASSTPFAYYKTTSGQGGIRVPMIIAGKGIDKREGFTQSGNMHVTDITPTILDWAGAVKPTRFNGHDLYEFNGKSAAPFLEGDVAQHRTADEPVILELNGFKSVVYKNHKLRFMAAKYQKRDGKGWKLFDLANDPAEQTDITELKPELVKEMMTIWDNYVADVGLVEKDWAYPEMYRRQTWSIRQDIDQPFNANPDTDRHYN